MDVEVGHHAGLSSIPVHVRVDANEAMMDAYCNLVQRKDAVVVPVPGIVKEQLYADVDLRWVDADVGDSASTSSGPRPHVAEHSSMKKIAEADGEEARNVLHWPPAAGAEYPPHGGLDVLLFALVQLRSIRNPRRSETFDIVGCERRRIGSVVSTQHDHVVDSSQRAGLLRRCATRSSIWRCSCVAVRPWSSSRMVWFARATNRVAWRSACR